VSVVILAGGYGTRIARRVQFGRMRRALESAKAEVGLDGLEDRLSWHSLRHSFASMLATDLELPATTLARSAFQSALDVGCCRRESLRLSIQAYG
jgi:integrase